MLYLLWGLLNTGLSLFFLIICFKATRLVREKVGLFAAIVFALGLLSFVGKSSTPNDNKEPNSNQIKTWKFMSEDSLKENSSYFKAIELENSLVSTYDLGIKYGKDKQEQLYVPISAYSSTTGFISGTNWKPVAITVNTTAYNSKFEYFVAGIVEWKLLGTTIYAQPKQYKGLVAIE